MCYNLAIKFKHCILCGNNKFRHAMKNIDGEIVMNNTILKIHIATAIEFRKSYTLNCESICLYRIILYLSLN